MAGKWLAHLLQMEDWDIRLCLSDEPPPWVLGNAAPLADYRGNSIISDQTKGAVLWVRSTQEDGFFRDGDPLVTLFHEYLHVFVADAGWSDPRKPEPRASEQAVVRLAVILAAAYRAKLKF